MSHDYKWHLLKINIYLPYINYVKFQRKWSAESRFRIFWMLNGAIKVKNHRKICNVFVKHEGNATDACTTLSIVLNEMIKMHQHQQLSLIISSLFIMNEWTHIVTTACFHLVYIFTWHLKKYFSQKNSLSAAYKDFGDTRKRSWIKLCPLNKSKIITNNNACFNFKLVSHKDENATTTRTLGRNRLSQVSPHVAITW